MVNWVGAIKTDALLTDGQEGHQFHRLHFAIVVFRTVHLGTFWCDSFDHAIYCGIEKKWG